MRRGFSIVLVLFFAFGPLSALVDGSDDASLPACCRRNGAHHCAMAAESMATRSRHALDPRTAVSAPVTCPNFPGLQFSMLMPAHAVAADSPAVTGRRVEPRAIPMPAILVSSVPFPAHAGR